jgi:hypothetical protein
MRYAMSPCDFETPHDWLGDGGAVRIHPESLSRNAAPLLSKYYLNQMRPSILWCGLSDSGSLFEWGRSECPKWGGDNIIKINAKLAIEVDVQLSLLVPLNSIRPNAPESHRLLA